MALPPSQDQPIGGAHVQPNPGAGLGIEHEWLHAVVEWIADFGRVVRGPVLFLIEAVVVLSLGGFAIAVLAYMWQHV